MPIMSDVYFILYSIYAEPCLILMSSTDKGVGYGYATLCENGEVINVERGKPGGAEQECNSASWKLNLTVSFQNEKL